MLKFIVVLLIGLSNLPKTTPCVAEYGKCGGVDYIGSTECCVPSTCVYSTPWYSQCIPNSAPSTTGCSAVYGQCGGLEYTGSTECCMPSTCEYNNPWYSQCLPISSSSSSSSSTDSTTIPTTTQSSSSSSSTDSSTTTESTSSSSISSTSLDCSALYDQCGGIGWNGSITCCSESICTYGNPYYSQCLSSRESSTLSSLSSPFDSRSVSSTIIPSENDNRQSGVTTRYWDCCKASCGWSGKASVTNPVQTCAKDGIIPVDVKTQSGCDGGSAYMCNNQQPWNVSLTLSYGYAAAHINGKGESDWCCACYSLIFISGPVAGKELIVQVTNTGGDLGNNHFDLQMPGGGVGIYDGCSSQFPGSYSWGERYGGVNQRSDCDNLPVVIRSGCYWRFDWFMNATNPPILFKEVKCPSVLSDNTRCLRV